MSNTKSTDLSREAFELKSDPKATKLHLISMIVSFCTGCVIGATLIMIVMKIFVG